MTKKQFISFCKTLGYSCSYSGNSTTMFVNTGAYLDIRTMFVQYSGFAPDFQIREV